MNSTYHGKHKSPGEKSEAHDMYTPIETMNLCEYNINWLERKALSTSYVNRPDFTIKKVIFNDPATIVFWNDKTKTVVKCGEHDEFDREKGLAMAICKKMMGNKGSYYNDFKKWIREDEAIEDNFNMAVRNYFDSLKGFEDKN